MQWRGDTHDGEMVMTGQFLKVPIIRGYLRCPRWGDAHDGAAARGAHGGEVPMMEQFLPVPITGGYLGCPQWGDAHAHGFSAPPCRS